MSQDSADLDFSERNPRSKPRKARERRSKREEEEEIIETPYVVRPAPSARSDEMNDPPHLVLYPTQAPYPVAYPNPPYPGVPHPYYWPTVYPPAPPSSRRKSPKISFRAALSRVLDGLVLLILGLAIIVSIAEASFLPFLATFFILSLVKALTVRKKRRRRC